MRHYHTSMNTSIIHTATASNYPEITAVWEASVRATHHFLTEADIQFYKPLILNEYLKSVTLYYIKGANNNIQGFIGIADHKIEMLFIHPDARGKGLGKLLLQYAVKEEAVSKVDVNEENEQAVAFYEHMGFVVVTRSPLDSSGKPHPILSMELNKSK